MTVSATNPYVAYIGAGTSGPFAIPFRFLADGDLLITKTDADGVVTTLTGNTITGADDTDGGELYTAAAVAVGETLKIARDTTRAQTAQYVANGPFPAATHERALDKSMLAIQEQDRDLGRSIMAPMGEGPLLLPPASNRASSFLAFDAMGNPTAAAGVTPPGLPVSAYMQTVLDDTSAASARATLDVAKRGVINITEAPYNAPRGPAGAAAATAAMIAAVAAAKATGWTIYIPGGAPFYFGQIPIDAPIRIVGDGSQGYLASFGSTIIRAAGTNADLFPVAMNSSFQESTFYDLPYLTVQGLTIAGNWGNNTSGGCFRFADGVSPWTAPQYGHCIKMINCQIREFNDSHLHFGINRNNAMIIDCSFRFSTKAIMTGNTCGDHKFIYSDFSQSGPGYHNIDFLGVFAPAFMMCNNFTSSLSGVKFDRCPFASWNGGEVNGQAQDAFLIIGNGAGGDYPVSLLDITFEGNSLDGAGLYDHISIADHDNVTITGCRFGLNALTPVGYLVRVNGATARMFWGANAYPANAYSVAPTNAGVEQFIAAGTQGAHMAIVGDSAFSFRGTGKTGWVNLVPAMANFGLVQADGVAADVKLVLTGKGVGGTQIGISPTTDKVAFFGATPVVQPSGAAQAAVTQTSTQTAGAAYTATEQAMLAALKADVTAIVAYLNKNRTDMVALGAIKGSA